ncbi:MAG TPA: NAD(P)/FAD-dependent oxidoreductase [Firmicutes bacterium]|nr:NAD(P)/FAD-dependent oxidoreductase [Bacillota bacterium]
MEVNNKVAFTKDLPEKGAILQRDKETFAIAPHIPGGIITDPALLRRIADVAEKYHAKVLKLTSAQRIAIVGIDPEKIDDAWADLDMSPGAAIGLCVRSVKICPATAFCKRAQQDGVSIGLAIDRKYHGMQLPSKFKIGVSGCMNSCAEPAVKDLGVMGTPKGFNILIGGNAGMRPRLANVLAEHVQPDQVLDLVDKVIAYYKNNARPYERFGSTIDRLGLETVKAAILEA